MKIGDNVVIAKSFRRMLPLLSGHRGTITDEARDKKRWFVKWEHRDVPETISKGYLVPAGMPEAEFPLRIVVPSRAYPTTLVKGKTRNRGYIMQERRDGQVKVKWDGLADPEWLAAEFVADVN